MQAAKRSGFPTGWMHPQRSGLHGDSRLLQDPPSQGGNDSTEEMPKLLRSLSAARIRPHYVFMCDPVAETKRFMVPLETARRIETECAERIGYLSLPQFVRDLPGSKRPPVCE